MSNSLTLFDGENLTKLEKASNLLCKSSLVPPTFRNKPHEVMSALILGYSLGLNEMQALLEINVIQGRPSISTKLMIALVKKQYTKCKFLWIRDTEKESVTLTLKLNDDCEGFTTTWDIPRASKMNLMGRDQYKKQLMTMLSWRCASEAIRFMAPDCVLGLYSQDEAMDLKDDVQDDDVERLWQNGKTEAELTPGDPEFIVPTRKYANKKLKDISIEEHEERYDKIIAKKVQNEQDQLELSWIRIYLESLE